nr:retrovirus-related Pol polyprotein from transposon TNT 1-94 [Tanacetum cinerariifolium]
MLADSVLPILFWAEAVNTACYVQNRVLVTKPYNTTPYELLLGRSPSIGFMRPFGCLVTILNTLDPLGKFDGKADEGFLVGYYVNCKAFRVFNSRTRIVQETLHINFLENKPNVTGIRPKWQFDIVTLTMSMNYQLVVAENQPNDNAGIKENHDADCGITHEPYQCQPKNHDYYHEQNSCYDSNSFGFDHGQPPRYTVNHPIFNAHNDLLNANNDLLNSQNKITIAQNKLMEQLTSMCAMVGQLIQKKQEEKQIEKEQSDNARYWKIPACCDDDDDDSAITPNEPVDSLSMGDEHLNTVLAMESDEFIKSYVENLVPNPSESEGESGCDVPACFTTFSNILFDADYEFDSDDDQSLHDEDISEKIFSKPLFEEEIISMKIDPHHFNAESDLVESLRIHDSLLIISSKIDSLLDEFAGELTLLKSIPSGIDCYHEEDIRLIERLLYDNSSPRPPEEFVSENSNADIESFSPSPIPIRDSDSLMEEIDLFLTSDDPMPPSIEEDDYDSEMDILILEELLDNYSLSLPENELFRFDIPSSSCKTTR